MARTIWVEGTSIEFGLGVAFSYINRALYPGGYLVINNARASRTIANNANNNTGATNSITAQLTGAGGLRDTLGPTNGANYVVYIGSGNTNDAYFGTGGAQSWTDFVTLLGLIRGYAPLAAIVMGEPFPRGDTNWSTSPVWDSTWGSSSVGPNQALADFTALARANWRAVGLARPPVNLNPVGAFGSPDSNTYYFQDTCHPTTAGHALAGAEWQLSRAWEA
jgi:hypothetical protein